MVEVQLSQKGQEGSPADDAGVQQGDLVPKVNQQKIHSLREHRAALGRVKGTDSVLFLVRRGDNVTYMAMRPGNGPRAQAEDEGNGAKGRLRGKVV